QTRIKTIQPKKYHLPDLRLAESFAPAYGSPNHSEWPGTEGDERQKETCQNRQERSQECKAGSGSDIREFLVAGARMRRKAREPNQGEQQQGGPVIAQSTRRVATRRSPLGPGGAPHGTTRVPQGIGASVFCLQRRAPPIPFRDKWGRVRSSRILQKVLHGR